MQLKSKRSKKRPAVNALGGKGLHQNGIEIRGGAEGESSRESCAALIVASHLLLPCLSGNRAVDVTGMYRLELQF